MSAHSGRRFAIVTRASSGIGYELARQFARHDFDLLVVAEDAELEGATRELETLGTDVEAMRVDLATPEGVEQVAARLDGRQLDGPSGQARPWQLIEGMQRDFDPTGYEDSYREARR